MWYFAAGDAGFYFSEQLKQLSWLPAPWRPEQGFGVSSLLRMWFDYPYELMIKLLSSLGLSWWFIDKLLWILVFTLASYSSFRLAKYVLQGGKVALLASFIYTFNTYSILLFAGGQIGVAFAYAFSPWVLYKLIESDNIKKNGIWLALLIAFDLRLAYLVILSFGVYIVFRGLWNRIIPSLVIPVLIAAGIHLFWILPTILVEGNTGNLGEQFTSPGMLKFLSVADFSHTLSFLHPNWPENLFGKVYFLQPEFLVLPILAFASLLFISRATRNKQQETSNKYILFFVFLSLVGAFFAKGVQLPFGGIFQWMFMHVPGFIMFRDPTKFYLFVALGYSILIPYTISQLKNRSQIAVYVLFVICWLLTIRAVFFGQITGNFRPLTLTSEYVTLKNILLNDSVPSRALWIPKQDKFAYLSDIHPIITSDVLFKNASVSAMVEIIKTPDFIKLIRENGIKYVIVPNDLEKKYFLTDYKFDIKQRIDLIRALDSTQLTPVVGLDSLKVYSSEHDPMDVRIPAFAARQQYWATIGLVISSIVILLVLLFYKNS